MALLAPAGGGGDGHLAIFLQVDSFATCDYIGYCILTYYNYY